VVDARRRTPLEYSLVSTEPVASGTAARRSTPTDPAQLVVLAPRLGLDKSAVAGQWWPAGAEVVRDDRPPVAPVATKTYEIGMLF
jgi:hypothetical protein